MSKGKWQARPAFYAAFVAAVAVALFTNVGLLGSEYKATLLAQNSTPTIAGPGELQFPCTNQPLTLKWTSTNAVSYDYEIQTQSAHPGSWATVRTGTTPDTHLTISANELGRVWVQWRVKAKDGSFTNWSHFNLGKDTIAPAAPLTTQAECEAGGAKYIGGVCVWGQDECVAPATPPTTPPAQTAPNAYTTETTCTGAGYNWCGNSCQSSTSLCPQTPDNDTSGTKTYDYRDNPEFDPNTDYKADWKPWEDTVKNRKRELKDLDRQMRDIGRTIETAGTPAVQQIAKCAALVENMKSLIEAKSDTTGAGDLQWEIDDCFSEIYNGDNGINDLWDIVREKEDKENNKRQLKDLERNIKDKARWIEKDMKKEAEKSGSSEAKMCHEKLVGFLNKMREAQKAGEVQDAWDYNSEIDQESQECWDLINVSREGEEFQKHRFPDTEREVRDRQREVDRMTREGAPETVIARLQGLIDEFNNKLETAKEFAAQKDYQGARDVLDFEMQDLREQWEQASQEGRMVFEAKFIKRDLRNAQREIADTLKRLDESTVSSDLATKCRGFITEKAEPMVEQGLERLEAGDLKWLEENGQALEQLGFAADKYCGFIIDHGKFGGPDVQGWIDEDFEGQRGDIMKQIMDKIDGEIQRRVMEKVNLLSSQLVDQLLEKVSERFEEAVTKTLEKMSWIAEKHQNAILEAQSKKLEKLEQVANRLGEALTKKIADYNFVGETAKKLEAKLESGTITETELDQLKEEAKVEKYESGIIPFKDTDDDQWFAQFAAYAKDSGIAQGRKDASGNLTGEFGPGLDVKRTEALKMALELIGITPSGSSGRSAFAGQWSNSYVASGIGLGMSIAKDIQSPGDDATRGEVVQSAIEAANSISSEKIDLNNATGTVFPDVPATHKNAAAIEKAAELGIIAGYPDGTFKPDNTIKRGEVAKILQKFGELIGK